jgi:predicted transcriptional regulator
MLRAKSFALLASTEDESGMSQPGSALTLNVPPEVRLRLEHLSKVTSRSQAKLALEAIESYLGLMEWQVEAIEKGIADADAGRFVCHEQVEGWLQSWGNKEEKEPPKWR